MPIDFDAADMMETPTPVKPDTSSVTVDTPQHDPSASPGMVEDVLVRGVAGGVEQAGRGVYSTIKAGADAVGANMPELGEPQIEAPEGLVGSITRDVTQFGLGFVGGMNLLRIGGAASKLAPVAKEILASGIGTGVVADPTAPRLSNLIQKYPWLENPVTEYLSQDDTDGVAESKFKSALEDMMLTPAAMVLFKTVKAAKNALKGNDSEAVRLGDEIAQDVKGVNAANDVLEVPEVRVTPENAAPEPGVKPVETAADEVVPATEIKTATGKVIFALGKDEAQAFDAHLDYLVKNDHLEDVFNFPGLEVLNPRRVDATPDTLEVVTAMAQYIKPKMDAAMYGERQSHESVKKLADLLQTDHNTLYANAQQIVQHMADLPATIKAMEGYTLSLAREARKLSIRASSEVATEADRQALLLAKERFADVFGMTLAIRKGSARAVSAGRITSHESDLVGKVAADAGNGQDLDELIRLLSLTEDEKQVIGVMKPKTMLGKLIDAHNEVWINGILGGVKTHVVNMVGATANTLLMPANQIIGGALMRNPQEIREGFALYRGLRRNFFDSMEMARRAFQSERSILDPGKSTDETIEKAISGKNFESLGRFADVLGIVARIPGRFLKAEDEFFKQMNYRAKIEAKASREAADLVQSGKLDPKKMVDFTDGEKTVQISEVEKFIQDHFKSSFDLQRVGLDKDALQYSREATFTQDLHSIKTWTDWGNPGASVQQFASAHPWLRGTILPFIKVPTNLMRTAGDYTPGISALKKEGWDILNGTETNPTKQAVFLGKQVTGASMWMAAGMLAFEGRITGSAYGDKQMRDRQMESGWQPYSFVLDNADGTKQYLSFQRLDPYGMFFGLAADWTYIAQHVDDQTKHNLATMMTLAVAKNLSSKSYLQGLVEWSSMLGGGYAAEEQVQRMIQMRVASYVPNYLPMYTGNDELKAVRSVMDAVMAKIPGLSSTVEAKRDYFGEKRMAPLGAPWNAINPFPASDEKDKVRVELARLARGQSEARFTMPDTKLGNLDLTEVKNSKGQTAYDRWTELIGQVSIGGKTFHQKLGDTIDSFRYQQGTDGTSAYHNGNRIVLIKQQQELYREKALREMLKEFDLDQKGSGQPSLRDMIRQDKRNERSVEHGRMGQIRDLLNLNK